MSFFAIRLKELRTLRDLSMQDLADLAGVSKSMISKIEREDVQPTLDVAARLAIALGKTLSEMLHATQATQVVVQTKADQAVWEDARHVKRTNISPVMAGAKVEWLRVSLPGRISIKKQAIHADAKHKYILIIKGRLELKINGKSYQLDKGDSIFFEANCEQEFLNPSKDVVEYYLVIEH